MRGRVADSEKDQSAVEMGVKLVQQIQAAEQTGFGQAGLTLAPRGTAGEGGDGGRGSCVYLEGLATRLLCVDVSQATKDPPHELLSLMKKEHLLRRAGSSYFEL